MTDFRALCAELLQPLAEYDDHNPYKEHRALITRARALLAQPEPPADGEVAELVAWLRTNADYALQKAATAAFKRFHHAADLLERLAQPEPQGPGPDDVTQLYYKHGGGDGMYGGMGEVNFEEAVEEALARWGRPAIEPVPGVEGADG